MLVRNKPELGQRGLDTDAGRGLRPNPHTPDFDAEGAEEPYSQVQPSPASLLPNWIKAAVF